MDQTIYKLAKFSADPYTRVHRDTFEAIMEIDPIAASIWVYLIGKPEDWIVRPLDVQKKAGISRNTYFKKIKVLRDFGVYWTVASTGADGKFRNGRICVSGEPLMASELPSAPKGDPVGLTSDRVPKSGTRVPNNGSTKKRDSRNLAPLQTKDSYKQKIITKGDIAPDSAISTRSRSIEDDLNDFSWADGLYTPSKPLDSF